MSPYSSLKRALAAISLTAREELKEDNINVSVVYPYITETDFEKNTIKDLPREKEWEDDGKELPPFDPPQHVAQKILEAIETGKGIVYAHAWMKKQER